MKSQGEYCRDILARIDMIRRFTEEGEAFFLQDERTQESVMRCFEIIGEIVKRLDTTLKDAYPLIDWKSYAGFRDVLIHQYDMILLYKVWDTVQNDLSPLETGVKELLKGLSSTNTGEA